MNMIKKWILCAGFAGGISCISAQTFNANYTTELQYNCKKTFNWVNLLRLEASLPVLKNGSLQCATIHVYESNKQHIIGDWQDFSNIEAENLAGSLAVLGYTQQFRKMSFFVGVRNVNEDYFTSPVTSLFTNSSCGIFPTISANYPLANYPLSALCVDYKLSLKHWNIQSTLYNGVGHSGFYGKENVFVIRPRRDGIFSISSLNYQSDVGSYFGGIALHNRLYRYNEEGERILEPQTKEEEARKKMNVAWWAYLEQSVYRNGEKRVDLLAQYSENRSVEVGCRRYAGVGAKISGFLLKHKENDLGLFVDYARYTYGKEIACEATWKLQLTDWWVMQPAFHWIKNDTGKYCAGVMRMTFKLF